MSKQFSGFIPLQGADESRDDLPRRADALANRAQILATAQRLFAERSIAAVTMADIATAAGVGKGTLYRAVANKGELCLALMDEDLRTFQDETLATLQAQHADSALDRLLFFLDRLTRFLDQHSELMCEAEIHGIHWQTRPEINQTSLHNWFHRTVLQLLRRAQEEGAVAVAGDVDYWADAILAPLNPHLFVYQRRQRGYRVDQISRRLQEFVLHGIGA